MRAAAIVSQRESLEEQDGLASPGQVVGRGRAHGPRTQDDMLGFDALHDGKLDGPGDTLGRMPGRDAPRLPSFHFAVFP